MIIKCQSLTFNFLASCIKTEESALGGQSNFASTRPQQLSDWTLWLAIHVDYEYT